MGGGPSSTIAYPNSIDFAVAGWLGREQDTGAAKPGEGLLAAIFNSMTASVIGGTQVTTPYTLNHFSNSILPYDPDGELVTTADVQTSLDGYKNGIDTLDYATDIDAIIAQVATTLDTANTSGVYTVTDPQSFVTSIFNDAITKALSAVSSIVPDVNTDLSTVLAVIDTDIRADLTSAVTDAVSAATAVSTGADVDTTVGEFEDRALTLYNRNVNDLSAQAVDANAVSGSAFVIGMALLQSQHDAEVRKFDSDLSINLYNAVVQGFIAGYQSLYNGVQNLFGTLYSEEARIFSVIFQNHVSWYLQALLQQQGNRASLINISTNDTVRMLMDKVIFQREATHLSGELGRVRIVAKGEEQQLETAYSVKNNLWNLELFQYGGNMLAAPGGGVMLPKGPTAAQSVLGGALGGIAAGAQAGSVIPGVGSVVGAGVGGLLGGIAGAI